jgi:hypothetical protein
MVVRMVTVQYILALLPIYYYIILEIIRNSYMIRY